MISNHNQTHNWLTCLDEMEKKIKKRGRNSILTINYPNYPCGSYWHIYLKLNEEYWLKAPTLPEAVIGCWEKVRANFKNSDKND